MANLIDIAADFKMDLDNCQFALLMMSFCKSSFLVYPTKISAVNNL